MRVEFKWHGLEVYSYANRKNRGLEIIHGLICELGLGIDPSTAMQIERLAKIKLKNDKEIFLKKAYNQTARKNQTQSNENSGGCYMKGEETASKSTMKIEIPRISQCNPYRKMDMGSFIRELQYECRCHTQAS